MHLRTDRARRIYAYQCLRRSLTYAGYAAELDRRFRTAREGVTYEEWVKRVENFRVRHEAMERRKQWALYLDAAARKEG